ncbi:MAG: peptidylprolyl isomerase [Methylacidiphilales bacterium]|nr:peptidylprolyl isomerase [Candidatus Methylacidiphilales bacterium]
MTSSPSRRSFLFRSLMLIPALFLAALMLITTGCHPRVTDPKDPKFIVAEKDNWQITRGDLDAQIAAFLKEKQMTAAQVGPANMAKLETGMLDNMVIQKLLLAKAATLPLKDVDKDEAAILDQLKSHYPSDQEFQDKLKAEGYSVDELKKRIHERVIVSKVMEQEAFHDDDPSEQEIQEIYLQNRQAFTHPAKIRASRILVLVDDKMSPAIVAAKKKTIEKARARVMNGEDFSKVALEVSEDQYSKSRGGDISFFQRGENEPGFDDVAFNTKVGQLSPVFQTALGFQFLKVTETRPAEEAPLSEARGYITEKLRQSKMEQQEKDYTTKLLANGGVTFHLVRADLNAPTTTDTTTTVTPAPTAAAGTSSAPAQ